MQCDEVQRRLSALADGELSVFRALRVRRHLSGCRTCAALLADVERVSAVAADIYADAPVPVTLRSRFIADAEGVTNGRATRRYRLTGRSIAVASALVALIGIGIAATSLYLSSQPTAAYAEIERAMSALPFRTIHLVGVSTIKIANNAGRLSNKDCWGRTDPPAIATTVRDSGGRMSSRWTESVGKDTLRNLNENRNCVYVSKNLTLKRLRKLLTQQSMLPDSTDGNQMHYSLFPGSAPGMHWELSLVVLDGRRLIRLEGTKGSWLDDKDSSGSTTLFADPETHLLTRTEYNWHYHGMDFHQCWTSIRYNETPPPNVFEDAK